MVFSKVEFAVSMKCQSCVESVTRALKGIEGIRNVDVNLKDERVVVDSSLPIFEIQSLLESTGKNVLIKGVGSKKLASAVAVLGYPVGFTTGDVRGVVRFTEVEQDCVVDGTIDGLQPGAHGIHIYSSGDLSQGCNSIGDHYNPFNAPHGGPSDDVTKRHVGDLGNIEADSNGRAAFRIIDKHIKLVDVIGRSFGVTAQADDLGRGTNDSSTKDGNSGERIGCGIIARSAGILENVKKVCFCSGRTLWEEKAFLSSSHSSETDQTSPKLIT